MSLTVFLDDNFLRVGIVRWFRDARLWIDYAREPAMRSLPYAVAWARQLLVDMSSGNKLNSYLIYLPTPVKTPQINIPIGLKIGGRKVQLVASGKGSGRLLGLGIQVGNKDKQFMRMDFHVPSPFHGNPSGTGMLAKGNDELAAWEDTPFHFHVLQYNGQSNK